MTTDNNIIDKATTEEYKYGFTTDIDTEILAHGLNEDVVRYISMKKGSRNGSSNSASRHSAIGSLSSHPHGLTSTFRKSISRP